MLLGAWPLLAGPLQLSPNVDALIERFFAPPEFADVALSPTGTHLAFYKEVDGKHVLATYNFKTAKLKLTAPSTGQRVVDFDWVGPNQLLFEYVQDEYKQDRPLDLDLRYSAVDLRNVYLGHWLTDADLTKAEEIPSLLDVVFEMVDPLPQDPTSVLLAQQQSDKFYSPLYRYNPVKNTIKLIEKNPGKIVRWLPDTTGSVRLALVAADGGKYFYLYRDHEKAEWQALALPEYADVITFDSTGQRLLVSYPNDSGRHVLQPFELSSRKFLGAPLADATYDVTPAVLRDPRTGVARALAFHTDRPKIIWLDSQSKQLHAILSAALPGYFVYPVGPTPNGEILVHAYADISPSEYYLFNPKSGTLQLFLDSRPKVRELALSPMTNVAFKATDGTELHGYLTRPLKDTGAKPLPLIALVHGGPQTRDNWCYDSEVQYYAALGYAVLQVNYRGSSGYGREFELKNIIDVGQRSVDDIADSLKWAVSLGIADPKRLIVCGGSYGGYIALGIATRYPDLAAGVIGFAGVYDWEFNNRQDLEKFTDLLKWDHSTYYPDLRQNASRYQAISPVHQAAAVKVPVLLIHGRQDKRVDIAQSELMAVALRKAGKSVEIVKDADGVHGLPDYALRRKYYETVTAFLLKNAPPDNRP